MSQAIEGSVRLFCIRCADVGLDCNYVVDVDVDVDVGNAFSII